MKTQRQLKVGIATHYAANNFGALLQCMALQDAICQELPESVCSVPDVYREERHTPPSFLSTYRSKRGEGVKGWLKGVIHGGLTILSKVRHRSQAPAQEFVDTAYTLDSESGLDDAGYLVGTQYDVLVAGSDQIWSFWAICPFFMLKTRQLPPPGKLAYAASCGHIDLLSNEQKEELKQELATYSAISSREADGASFLGVLSNKECPCVLDPTLLHDIHYWQKYARPPKKKPVGEFCFTYSITYDFRARRLARQVAKKIGCQLIMCDYVAPHSYYSTIGPREFLWYIAHARCVITTSFHGTALSIISGTPFYSIRSSAPQSRLTTLLSLLGLEHRLISSVDEVRTDEPAFTIEEVNEKLLQPREKSRCYLRESILKAAESAQAGRESSLVQ